MMHAIDFVLVGDALGVRIRRHGRRFLLHFSVQHKVVEAIIRSSLGTLPSERARGAVLTMSLDSGVATGVTAVTISQQADGLLSKVVTDP